MILPAIVAWGYRAKDTAAIARVERLLAAPTLARFASSDPLPPMPDPYRTDIGG